MRPLPVLIALLTLAAPLAGCITPPGEEDSGTAPAASADGGSRDAHSKVVTGSFGGTKSDTEAIPIPRGTQRLEVFASWSVGGSASFALYDPDGRAQKRENVNGGASRGGSTWVAIDDPRPGTWELKVTGNGGGSYHFEFTW